MKKKDEQQKDLGANADLNQKIESLMGPTETGEPPVQNVPIEHIPGIKPEAEVTSAPELPDAPAEQAEKTAEESAKQPEVIEPTKEEPTNSDPDLDKVVDEIAESDSDKLLKVEDKERALAAAPQPKKSFGQKVKNFFKAWWGNPKSRNATLVFIVLVIIGLVAYPTTRYFLLNTAGVRAKASVMVLDNSTQQPLKNVTVTVGGQTAATDENGKVQLEKVKLGSTQLVIKKRAFATIDKKIVLGWGSNPLGEAKLEPAGVQYTFKLSDFLSGNPIEKAEAVSGESSAFSDKDGKLVLTLDKDQADANEVTIKAKDYRDEKRALGDDMSEQQISMVPSHKHAFVSKRSGKLDVYKIDVDGTNEEVVLAGSGAEQDDMVIVPSSSDNNIAVVSTRDNQRNGDGYLLHVLNVINLDDNKVTTVARSERIQIIGWSSGRLVYVQIAEGASGTNPKRHRLMSYDLEKEESQELASANYFNDVLMANNTIYYAPAAAYQNGSDVSLFKISPDGTNKQSVYSKETWNIFRTDFEQLTIAVQQDWFEYSLLTQKAPNKITPPANPRSRIYINSPDGKRSIWIDSRDGKGALIVYNTSEKKETVAKTESGLKYPANWVSNDTLVYRIATDQETADYVINLSGGEAKKIRDVTNTGGIDNWYYY